MEVSVATALVEKRGDRSDIHFEPGIHPRTEDENVTVYNGFYKGDLDVHGWNKEVGERIASYAWSSPALLLTIDGVVPQPPSVYPQLTSLQEAIYTWVRLPARPIKLNQTGKIYVVKGDTDYYRLPQAVLPTVQESASLKQQMDAKYHAEVENSSLIQQQAIVGETAIITALGMVLWAANKYANPLIGNQKISRRQFLDKTIKAATGTVGVGSFLRYELPNITTVIPHKSTEEFFQIVDNVVRPRLVRSTFIDGRTALLLAKAEDAQPMLGDLHQAKNVVVMGSAHTDMVSTYLQGKEERNNAIAGYAGELLETAKEVYATYNHVPPEHTPTNVIQSVLNYVSQVDIVEVSDPGGSSFQPDFPRTVDKQMTPLKTFNSPQVEQAIQHLRPSTSLSK